MKVTYAPEGAEPHTWEFQPGKLMNVEAEAIERHTDMTFGEWAEAVPKMSMRALHGLLYVLLKREIPTLKWDEVQFCADDLTFDLDDVEKADLRAELTAKRADGKASPDELEALAEIEAAIGPEPADDEGVEPEAPKAHEG